MRYSNTESSHSTTLSVLLLFGGLGLNGCAASNHSVDCRTPAARPVAAVHSATTPHICRPDYDDAPAAACPVDSTSQIQLVAKQSVSEDSVLEESTETSDTPETLASDHDPSAADVSMNVRQTPMDLGNVLSMVGGQHPTVGFAKWRVQQAYAEQLRSETLWLPSIQAGVSAHQHDGNLQASNGAVQDVNRSSLQAGLGTGAVGAGTTPNPGIVARFHMADAIYAPSIAEKNAWAQGHAATAAVNDQLLNASLAWLELLTSEQSVAVLRDTLERTQQLSKITVDFAESGQGLRSDADRLNTEMSLANNRLIAAKERAEVANARLIEAISAQAGQRIIPMEQGLVPILLVEESSDPNWLISEGLRHRPELREAKCLVSAACEQYERQKFGPFVPSVLLGMSQSGFGGGRGTTADNFGGRTDFDAALTWELRGLGYGELAARRNTAAQVEQARFRQVRLMDQVAREITEAHAQSRFRSERITIAKQGIQSAEESVRSNIDRIRNAQGLPIEALQSIRALEDARLALLQAISDYNEAQFRLHRAIGHPVYDGQKS